MADAAVKLLIEKGVLKELTLDPSYSQLIKTPLTAIGGQMSSPARKLGGS